MAIYYGHEANGSGGFVAGDSETGLTAYAYWSSTNWKRAFTDPWAVARHMLANEAAWERRYTTPNLVQYDQRNWAILATIVL